MPWGTTAVPQTPAASGVPSLPAPRRRVQRGVGAARGGKPCRTSAAQSHIPSSAIPRLRASHQHPCRRDSSAPPNPARGQRLPFSFSLSTEREPPHICEGAERRNGAGLLGHLCGGAPPALAGRRALPALHRGDLSTTAPRRMDRCSGPRCRGPITDRIGHRRRPPHRGRSMPSHHGTWLR